MKYKDNTFISARDLSFKGVLHDIKKSRTALQPVFEAFTNAIEAIKIKQLIDSNFRGKIELKIEASENNDTSSDFNKITITDNGVGFNDIEFNRFNTFKETSKGFKNLGSGRIQFVHFFDNTVIKSVYFEKDKWFEREFVVSKNKQFLDNNAIVKHRYCKEVPPAESGTSLTFQSALENSNIYNSLNEQTLKTALLERYIHYFCYNKTSLPKIDIKFYVQSKLRGEETIKQLDIPEIDKTESLNLYYSKISSKGNSIVKTNRSEVFKVDAFKVKKELLNANKLNLVSKGEIVEESDVLLQSLSSGDNVKGYKYLFLLSSDYIEARDSNMRGELNIPDRDSFSKNANLFTSEEILIEDIQEGVNNSINTMYPEIEEVKKKHDEQFEKLKEMFLLDDETSKNISISINDSESKILEKFYEAEAKKSACIDANIKNSIDSLQKLDTTSVTYQAELEKEVERLVKFIPLQNKTNLTHYVARRKLVLELFNMIIDKNLLIQNELNRNIDEKLLHNLIFQQTSSSPEESDLWLVNEDFIYFKGTSEDKLKDIQVNGENLLRDDLTKEEEEFRVTLNENRYDKRPDVLLFPDEGKCIIIEFKNPKVNVADHLMQINNYASLIWNFAKPEFRFHTFYGYLIGEKMSAMDVRAHDGDFKEAYHFDYLFRPHKVISGLFTTGDASLYTEVIKYSTLLQRAQRRNEIFIKKLTKPDKK